jgi:hypothetical protein
MLDESPSSMSGSVWRERLRGPLLVGTVVAAMVVMVAVFALLGMLLPSDRAAVQLRGPVPRGEEFAEVNRVSQWPADWIAAVCEPPVYPLRTPYVRLPHSTANAVCRARIHPNGDVVNLTIARFSAELPMQVDLLNDGYKWYAFAFDRGKMTVFATFSDVMVTDPVTNLGESPVLQPLKQFGFNIYSGPGP